MTGSTARIESAYSRDVRYALPESAGTDAIHSNPEYCLAVTLLETDISTAGTGLALTLGDGNRIVCELIDMLCPALIGREIEELMADFGSFSRSLANHPQLRWLGPHKGAVHLALASIVNACFDLWAKVRGVPLWKLLLDLSPERFVQLLDLSYLEDVLTEDDCLIILQQAIPTRGRRANVLASGYPGYDTSVGWFRYDDERLRLNMAQAMEAGFRAFKLKVGSADPNRDLRRAHLLREMAGDEALLMFDANQQWSYPQALAVCKQLADLSPYWVEEPTHPDDIVAHRHLAEAIMPVRIAAGEHIPNRVVFKNFMEARALHFVQVDCTRVGGIGEFLTVSLMAQKYGLPVVPHVGDMGQIHQHLVLVNHIAMGQPVEFLEHIPHLQKYFTHPAVVKHGIYRTSQTPGTSADLIEISGTR